MHDQFEILDNGGDNLGVLLSIESSYEDAVKIKEYHDKQGGYSPHHNIIQIYWVRRPVRVLCRLCSESYLFSKPGVGGVIDPEPIKIDCCPSCNEDYFMIKRKIGVTDLHFISNWRWSQPTDPKFYLLD